MKDELSPRPPPPFNWEGNFSALGKSRSLFSPSLVRAWRLRAAAVGECLKMRRGLFKFMDWRGKREYTTSLPMRLPEVCKILVKTARGVSALHHIAA